MLTYITENSDIFIKTVHKLIVRFCKENNLMHFLSSFQSKNCLSYYQANYFTHLVPLLRGYDTNYVFDKFVLTPIIISITDNLPCQYRTLTIKYNFSMDDVIEINLPIISMEMFYFSCILSTILITKFRNKTHLWEYDIFFAKIPEFFKCDEKD